MLFLWIHINGGVDEERLTAGRHLGGYCNRLGEKKRIGIKWLTVEKMEEKLNTSRI